MAVPHNPSNRRPQWLEGRRGSRVLSFVVLPVLVIAVLLLPPLSVPERIRDAGTTTIGTQGGTLTDPDGTQVSFMPGTVDRLFRASLSSVPRVAFLEGSSGKDLLAAAKGIPSQLVAKSPFYQLETRGDATANSTWTLPIPNDSEPYETLDLYTWDAANQTWQWLPHTILRDDDQIEARLRFVPGSMMIAQTNRVPATVSADLKTASTLPAEAKGALAQVQPTGLYLGDNGSLSGSIDATFDKMASGQAIAPVIRNYDGPVVRTDLLHNMLVDKTQRSAHVAALVNLAVGNLYSGIDIDYRGLDPADRADYNQFISELATKLHAQNKTLGLRVEGANQVAEDRWETGAYDWQTLGLLADSLKIPAPLDPRAYMPGGQVDALLNYAVGQVNRYKLQLVLSGSSVEQAGSYLLQKSYKDAVQPLIGRIEADKSVVESGKPLNLALVSTRPNSGLVYDPNIGAYVYRYQDDQGNARTVWLENAASLSHKLQLINRYGIQGFMVENLPADGQDADLWSVMRDYQAGNAKAIDSNFVVEWTVRDSNGQLISQVRPLASPGVQVAAALAPGALEVRASLIDRGQVLGQQSAEGLTVGSPSATPAPPTPTPAPATTATAAPQATSAAAEVSVKAGTINVRSGPSTDYPKVADAAQGTGYKVVGKSEDGKWWQITVKDVKGWVSADLVVVSGPTDSVATVKAEPLPTPAPQPTANPNAPAPVVAAPPPSGGGAFAMGVQVDPVGGHMNAIPGMGLRWVKFQVPWKQFEQSRGSKGFPDGWVDEAKANGLAILASIVKAPDWARNPAYGLKPEGPPANPADYASYVGAFASHFCGKVNAVEVWNEQNMNYEWGYEPLDPAAYMRLLKPAYAAIKQGCPSMLVISGAPTPAGMVLPAAYDDRAYLEAMYQNGLANYADGVGVHPSGFGNPPDVTVQDFQAGRYSAPSHTNHTSFYFLNTLQDYRNIMVRHGDSGKRLWPTEFGWGSTPNPHPGYEYEARISEQQQADYIVKAFTRMRNSGYVATAFLWCLDYNVTQPSTELAAFGILGRPAYAAIAAMPK